jgi:hypothetical protein
MAGFKIEQFKGIRPLVSALKLDIGEAGTAENVQLGSGDIQPWVDVDVGRAVYNTYFNKTIYLFDNAGNPRWFEWDNYVSVARGSVKGDVLERTYYTGDGVPKMTYTTIADGGGPYPSSWRKLGIPAPTIPPTVEGAALPETVDSADRRTLPNSLVTELFEIVFANFTVYPGTGTPTDIWTLNAAATGDITFDLQAGDSIRVTEVIDANTVRLGSATGSGSFAVTASNDKSSDEFWQPMDEAGSTQEADFTGWRIPDGIRATILQHKLRAGDVIRVTRSDYSNGLIFPFTAALSFYEQSWATPVEVTIDGSTFYQAPNGRLGANADATADFAALEGGFYYDVDRDASDSNILEDRSYVYTFVSNLGEEGPPSPLSAAVNALDGDTISITGMEAPPTLFYEITKMRLYRTSSTAAGTEFQFVKEFDVSTTTTESVTAQNLGEILATTTWDAPPEDMQGITTMPNGMMVGFTGKTVHMCEPYFPHAWPAEYDQAVNYNIVALAALGNSVAVLTEGVPSILTGSHPRNANLRPYKINQACVSAESVASTADSIMYASPDGLVEISINGVKILTAPWADKKEWADFEPTTIRGEIHDGKYFGFFGGTASVPQSPATALLTGTVTTLGSEPDETDIVAGGKTIIITLVSDTWVVAAGGLFDNQRQNIIDNILSSGEFVTGWNETVLPNIPVTDVVRTSDTVVTITLTARPEYSITDLETISVLVPGTAVAGGVDLPITTTFYVAPLQDYSTIAIAFTDFDATSQVPYGITSQLDIIDWDSYEGVGSVFNDEVDITAATYSTNLDRWLAVGFRDAAAAVLPSTAVFSTSDDDGVTWTLRTHADPSATNKTPRTALWYEDHGVFIVGGDNLSIQVSPDAENWQLGSVVPTVSATASLRSLVISSNNDEDFVYAGLSSVNKLIRSPDLRLFPAHYPWSETALTYVAATGTKLMASGGGKILSIGADDTNMDICETTHGGTTGSSVGAISTYNCQGLVLGNDVWVAVSDDFRIVTCASGSEGTIGSWSAPSVTKAANVTINGIVFDQGDSLTQAYGFIAFGVNTSTSKGVVYTSPDGTTWTLRHTQTESVPVTAMAVKYPETQLASSLLDFSPTIVGAVAPTSLGQSSGTYSFLGFKGSAHVDVRTIVGVTSNPVDAVISLSGSVDGTGTEDVNSPVTAVDPIFNLNEQPDEIRITLDSLVKTATYDGFEWDATASANPTLPFNDAEFFVPVSYFKYGYAAHTYARAIGIPDNGVDNSDSDAVLTQTFTFRKAGYNDYSISFKMQSTASAEGESTA